MADLIKNVIRQGLRLFGLEIRRARSDRSGECDEQGPSPIEEDEVRQLEHDLRAFAEQHPEIPVWSNPESARDYLDDRRLRFYHDLLTVCGEEGLHLGGRRIADVGSGTGYLLRLIDQGSRGTSLVGFDNYREITSLARHLCPAARFEDRDLYDVSEGRFDVVFCTEVLEHLTEPHEALYRLLSLVKSDGRLVLTVPNGRLDRLPAHDKFDNGRGYWGHINFWSPESWPLFLSRTAPDWRIGCGLLPTGENYAVMQQRDDPLSVASEAFP